MNQQLLSADVVNLINNPTNKLYVSMTSFYEISIKINIGKLEIKNSLIDFYEQTILNQINVLPIEENHLEVLSNLPLKPNHKDPFDRLIIATAIAENCVVISADNKFQLYKDLIKISW
jgi:PIN domain nuclease of toxin-antitoxin system